MSGVMVWGNGEKRIDDYPTITPFFREDILGDKSICFKELTIKRLTIPPLR
jgi:hypothetical protein